MSSRNTIRIEDPVAGDLLWTLPTKLDQLLKICTEDNRKAVLRSITVFLTKMLLFVSGGVMLKGSTQVLVEFSKMINAYAQLMIKERNG